MASWSIPWPLSGWHKNELCKNNSSLVTDPFHNLLDAQNMQNEFEERKLNSRTTGDESNFRQQFLRLEWIFWRPLSANRVLLRETNKNRSSRRSTMNFIQIKVRFVYNLLNCARRRQMHERSDLKRWRDSSVNLDTRREFMISLSEQESLLLGVINPNESSNYVVWCNWSWSVPCLDSSLINHVPYSKLVTEQLTFQDSNRLVRSSMIGDFKKTWRNESSNDRAARKAVPTLSFHPWNLNVFFVSFFIQATRKHIHQEDKSKPDCVLQLKWNAYKMEFLSPIFSSADLEEFDFLSASSGHSKD